MDPKGKTKVGRGNKERTDEDIGTFMERQKS